MRVTLVLLIVVCQLFSINSFSQGRFGAGANAIYNFQSGGIGIGLQGDMNVSKRLILASLVDYYPSFNTYHELYVGIESIIPIFHVKKSWIGYPLLVGYYQMLFNHGSFGAEKSKFSNFTYEAGLGFSKAKGTIKPLVELRYDIKWKEVNLRAGVMWYFPHKDKVHKRYQYIWKI
ncbi:MAG: hypothetical protein HRT72_07685 [Flavobacteriales bacterium]|nr:hypothetical protein [Flavobacteriales bacterium]